MAGARRQGSGKQKVSSREVQAFRIGHFLVHNPIKPII